MLNCVLMFNFNILYPKHIFYIEQIKENKYYKFVFPSISQFNENQWYLPGRKIQYLPPVIPNTGFSRLTLI